MDVFIEQYFSARAVVNDIKETFGSNIHVDLVHKDIDGGRKVFHANIDKIDNFVTEKYTPLSLRDALTLFWTGCYEMLGSTKKAIPSSAFSDFIRNASSAEKKKVYKKVIEKANLSQKTVLEQART